jgi:hypothetical protein
MGSWFPALLPMTQYAVARHIRADGRHDPARGPRRMGNRQAPTADVDDVLSLAELPTLTAIVSAYLLTSRSSSRRRSSTSR